MSAYLVRLIQNRDIVGFFAADDFDDLVIAVDECTEVSACEFVELPPGGIMWTSPRGPCSVRLEGR
jgi:ferredoxin-like protein FixX